MSTDVEAPRLDVLLAERRGITRHAARTLIDAGLVTVNGRRARAGQRVRGVDSEHISVGEATARPAPLPAATAASSAAAPELNIVYEDAWLAVVDKPAGMVVHPAAGHREGTLADALRARGSTWSLLGGEERAGIVHRLDRETSGLLVVAKSEAAHRALAEQLRDRTLGRVYWTLVQGGFKEETGTVDAPIARDPRNRKRMWVVDEGRQAITDFRVIERLGAATRLEVSLRTGRTHQIRVHLAYIGHAVSGDTLYGRADPQLGRPALHATRLRFTHPDDGRSCVFDSPPPADLMQRLDSLRAARR